VDVLDEAELGWRLDGRPLIGVTGTNGKGTCAALVCAGLRAAGHEPLLAGNTHFGPPLSEAPDRSGDIVVAELSSFQLAGSPNLLPEASLFTNLGHQHWDYHGSREAYADAKRRMFVRGARTAPAAAVNGDDGEGRRLIAEIRRAGGSVVTYGGSRNSDYRVAGCDWSPQGSVVELVTPSGPVELETRLAGAHNALNVAGALALLAGLGLDSAASRNGLAEMSPVPGRFEAVSSAGEPITVIVDFAHNPHGIEAALVAGRRLVDAEGGGRLLALSAPLWVHDPPMRSAMVRTLRALADEVVITTQRWRLSEPLSPPPNVLEEAGRPGGCRCTVVDEREEAIHRILGAAVPGDVVMLLGRGALTGDLYDHSDRPRPFTDRAVAEEALRRRAAAVPPAATPV
jgi:UDP-N-acetylmuramoyl-L-alanyl-D-glutamate--2,6-diaminopimelate ligase